MAILRRHSDPSPSFAFGKGLCRPSPRLPRFFFFAYESSRLARATSSSTRATSSLSGVISAEQHVSGWDDLSLMWYIDYCSDSLWLYMPPARLQVYFAVASLELRAHSQSSFQARLPAMGSSVNGVSTDTQYNLLSAPKYPFSVLHNKVGDDNSGDCVCGEHNSEIRSHHKPLLSWSRIILSRR